MKIKTKQNGVGGVKAASSPVKPSKSGGLGRFRRAVAMFGVTARGASLVAVSFIILACSIAWTYFPLEHNSAMFSIADMLHTEPMKISRAMAARMGPVSIGIGVQFLVIGLMDRAHGGHSATITVFGRIVKSILVSTLIQKGFLPPIMHAFSVVCLLSAAATAACGLQTLRFQFSRRGMLMAVAGLGLMAATADRVWFHPEAWDTLASQLASWTGLHTTKVIGEQRTAMMLGSIIIATGWMNVLAGLSDDDQWAKASIVSMLVNAGIWAHQVNQGLVPSIMLVDVALWVLYAVVMAMTSFSLPAACTRRCRRERKASKMGKKH